MASRGISDCSWAGADNHARGANPGMAWHDHDAEAMAAAGGESGAVAVRAVWSGARCPVLAKVRQAA